MKGRSKCATRSGHHRRLRVLRRHPQHRHLSSRRRGHLFRRPQSRRSHRRVRLPRCLQLCRPRHRARSTRCSTIPPASGLGVPPARAPTDQSIRWGTLVSASLLRVMAGSWASAKRTIAPARQACAASPSQCSAETAPFRHRLRRCSLLPPPLHHRDFLPLCHRLLSRRSRHVLPTRWRWRRGCTGISAAAALAPAAQCTPSATTTMTALRSRALAATPGHAALPTTVAIGG